LYISFINFHPETIMFDWVQVFLELLSDWSIYWTVLHMIDTIVISIIMQYWT
jgi:hypothetical protein